MNRNFRHPGRAKAQSTVEYIVLVAAVIAVIIIFLGNNGTFSQRLNSTLDQATSGMTNMAGRLGN